MRVRKVGIASFVVLLGLSLTRSALAAASCTTYDAQNLPTSTFRGGEKIVVRGTGFAPNARVLISLQQGTRTFQLSSADANDLGAFASTDTLVPRTVAEGEADIRAIDARGSASCPVTLEEAAAEEDGLSGVFWIWGALLAVFAIVLGALTYRRWKTERLKEAVDSLSWRERVDPPGDQRVEAARSPDRTPILPFGRPERTPARPAIGDREAARPPRPREKPAPPESFDPVLPRARPAFDESMRSTAPFLWQDDDASPIGAPRPFDDRFAVDGGLQRDAPWSAGVASHEDAWTAPRPEPMVEELTNEPSIDGGREPFVFDDDRASAVSPDRPTLPDRPVAARSALRSAAVERPVVEAPAIDPSFVEPRPSEMTRSMPRAPAAEVDPPAGASERSFAQVLREFLDAEDARTDGRDAQFRRRAPATLPASAPSRSDAVESPMLDRPFVPAARPEPIPEAPRPSVAAEAIGTRGEPIPQREDASGAGPRDTDTSQAPAAFRPPEPRRPDPPERSAPPAGPAEHPAPADEPPIEAAADLPSRPRPAPSAPMPARAPVPAPSARPVRAGAPGAAPDAHAQPPKRSVDDPAPSRAVPRPSAVRPPPRRPGPDAAANDEPSVLPVGWDEGRLRPPGKRSSEAIERLRREVRDWRR